MQASTFLFIESFLFFSSSWIGSVCTYRHTHTHANTYKCPFGLLAANHFHSETHKSIIVPFLTLTLSSSFTGRQNTSINEQIAFLTHEFSKPNTVNSREKTFKIK